jgi:hypothetical protein
MQKLPGAAPVDALLRATRLDDLLADAANAVATQVASVACEPGAHQRAVDCAIDVAPHLHRHFTSVLAARGISHVACYPAFTSDGVTCLEVAVTTQTHVGAPGVARSAPFAEESGTTQQAGLTEMCSAWCAHATAALRGIDARDQVAADDALLRLRLRVPAGDGAPARDLVGCLIRLTSIAVCKAGAAAASLPLAAHVRQLSALPLGLDGGAAFTPPAPTAAGSTTMPATRASQVSIGGRGHGQAVRATQGAMGLEQFHMPALGFCLLTGGADPRLCEALGASAAAAAAPFRRVIAFPGLVPALSEGPDAAEMSPADAWRAVLLVSRRVRAAAASAAAAAALSATPLAGPGTLQLVAAAGGSRGAAGVNGAAASALLAANRPESGTLAAPQSGSGPAPAYVMCAAGMAAAMAAVAGSGGSGTQAAATATATTGRTVATGSVVAGDSASSTMRGSVAFGQASGANRAAAAVDDALQLVAQAAAAAGVSPLRLMLDVGASDLSLSPEVLALELDGSVSSGAAAAAAVSGAAAQSTGSVGGLGSTGGGDGSGTGSRRAPPPSPALSPVKAKPAGAAPLQASKPAAGTGRSGAVGKSAAGAPGATAAGGDATAAVAWAAQPLLAAASGADADALGLLQSSARAGGEALFAYDLNAPRSRAAAPPHGLPPAALDAATLGAAAAASDTARLPLAAQQLRRFFDAAASAHRGTLVAIADGFDHRDSQAWVHAAADTHLAAREEADALAGASGGGDSGGSVARRGCLHLASSAIAVEVAALLAAEAASAGSCPHAGVARAAAAAVLPPTSAHRCAHTAVLSLAEQPTVTAALLVAQLARQAGLRLAVRRDADGGPAYMWAHDPMEVDAAIGLGASQLLLPPPDHDAAAAAVSRLAALFATGAAGVVVVPNQDTATRGSAGDALAAVPIPAAAATALARRQAADAAAAAEEARASSAGGGVAGDLGAASQASARSLVSPGSARPGSAGSTSAASARAAAAPSQTKPGQAVAGKGRGGKQ